MNELAQAVADMVAATLRVQQPSTMADAARTLITIGRTLQALGDPAAAVELSAPQPLTSATQLQPQQEPQQRQPVRDIVPLFDDGPPPPFLPSRRPPLAASSASPSRTEPKAQPKVPVKSSVFSDYIVCLCCGKNMIMLKRHVREAHGLTVDEYRARFDLPAEYPITAPGYAESKRQYAKSVGLGTYERETA